MKSMLKRFNIVVIFGIGLAFIEAVVVVYLRTLFYPEGFVFPLTNFMIDEYFLKFLRIETFRELATLAVLFSSSWLMGKNFRTRSAYFLVIFAVWDIFYYVWLKVLLGWPISLLDWDILFLIPLPWAGPVLAPVIISITMIGAAVLILYRESSSKVLKIYPAAGKSFVIISLLFLANFCYAGMHVSRIDYKSYFSWPLFIICEAAAVFFIIKTTEIRKSRNTNEEDKTKEPQDYTRLPQD